MIAVAVATLLLAGAAYAVLALLAHHWSLRLLFPRPPASYGRSPEVQFLEAEDGVRIAARFWPAPQPRRTVLWLHGNGEDLGGIADTVDEWNRRGFAVFAIDYRGYGLSEGRPDEANTVADARRALAWLATQQGVPSAEVVVVGYSLGGGPAVDLAVELPLAGLILLAPFVSAYRVMTRLPLLLGDKFENLRKIGRLRCPVLVVHGTEDDTVPLWHGRRLFAAATVPKSRLWVDGAGHTDFAEVAGEAYWAAIDEFIARIDDAQPTAVPAGG